VSGTNAKGERGGGGARPREAGTEDEPFTHCARAMNGQQKFLY
jgi:hypothetical protein